MTTRDETILKAAFNVFLRYGIKRTSMSDIAEEAGISRQTLYNSFSNKNDIVQAGIALDTDEAMARIDAHRAENTDLHDRLTLIIEELVLKPYDMIHLNPNAGDLMEGFNDTAKEALEARNQSYVDQIKKTLAPFKGDLVARGRNMDDLADYIVASAHGAKYVARDRDHLVRMTTTLADIITDLMDASVPA